MKFPAYPKLLRRARFLALLATALRGALVAADDAPLSRLARTDERGRRLAIPHPTDPAWANPPHSPEWLEGWRDRMDRVIRTSTQQRFVFNTWFENEKYALGQAMAMALAGDARGIRALSERDVSAGDWHRETAGIDFYACFVIKHQPRKYFYFRPLLPPDYVRQMADGGRAWTERDPLRRPHHLYQPGKQGWGPDAKNSWVDVRTTDNLTMMRNTAVYLMAEDAGNTAVADIYRDRIRTFAVALYRAGNGEWDSENYLGHTMAPIFNTYDFARDPRVRGMSKAFLDWLAAAMAVKYYRGAANGPTCRDYNHVQPYQGSLAETAWMMFGPAGNPRNPESFEYDIVHMFTSGWLPPPAIVNLGINNFERPRELLNSKPSYNEPQRGDFRAPPAYHETYYIGRTFEFGSLAEGTSPDGGDVNGFKLMANDAERGVLDLQVGPTRDVGRVGSPQYQQSVSGGPNRVAQYRNIAIWLVKNGASDWSAVLPEKIPVEVASGVTFIRGDETWIALTPIGMKPFVADPERTRDVKGFTAEERYREKVVNPETGKEEQVWKTRPVHRERWPEHQGLAAKGDGSAPFCGFAIEVGESPDFKDYADFRRAVLERARLDASGLAQGRVSYRAAGGATVAMEWGDRLEDFKVWRNGEPHPWAEHGRYVWREAGKLEDGLIFQRRGEAGGTLVVNAGGRTFRGTLDESGNYRFENR